MIAYAAHYAACALFAVFGVRLLKEVLEDDGKGGPSEELEEVEFITSRDALFLVWCHSNFHP